MTIGLAAIVKNEAEYVGRMCLSAIPVVDSIILADTGSTDGTQQLAKGAYDAEVHEIPWVNFGQARTRLLELARGRADWLLTLDADMTVEIDPDFAPDPLVEAYLAKVAMGSLEWRLPLLIRGDLPWRSVGAVHEYLDLPGRQYVRQTTDAIRVTVEQRSSPEKSRWHAALLEAEMAKHPGDPRTVFYLAQTYRDLGDDRARRFYLERATMGGWDEEVFYARYQAARLAEWPQRQLELLAAWESRPHRLEPLWDLVIEYNRRDMHQAAYALTAVDVKPCEDILFVTPAAWDWGLLFERSIAAWWTGHRDEAHRINDHLLSLPGLPEHIRAAVERNAAF